MTDLGALSGSREPSQQAVSAASGFDPERIHACLGYFDGPSDVPAFDPGPSALCPACNKPMGPLSAETTLARSLWVINGRCHFFYYHVACREAKGRIDAFEGAAVDEIARSEDVQ